MRIDRQEVGTVQVLTPQGPLIDDDVAEFAGLLGKKLASPNPRVVLAMQEVQYLDSRALEALLDASDELQKRSARLKIAGLTATCRETLELTGLAARFQLFERVQDAVRSFL